MRLEPKHLKRYVRVKLLEVMKEEGVEPPEWFNSMVNDITRYILEEGIEKKEDIDYEIRRAVWVLKDVMAERETVEAEIRLLEEEALEPKVEPLLTEGSEE